jgi:hypothetical protein
MNECDDCKDLKDCIAVKEIWDGSDIIRKGEDWLKSLKSCQIREIRFNIDMKDHWEESDFAGVRLLNAEIERRK